MDFSHRHDAPNNLSPHAVDTPEAEEKSQEETTTVMPETTEAHQPAEPAEAEAVLETTAEEQVEALADTPEPSPEGPVEVTAAALEPSPEELEEAVAADPETSPEEVVEELAAMMETTAEEQVEALADTPEPSPEEPVEVTAATWESSPEELGEAVATAPETSPEEVVEEPAPTMETPAEELVETLADTPEPSPEEPVEVTAATWEPSPEELGEAVAAAPETSFAESVEEPAPTMETPAEELVETLADTPEPSPEEPVEVMAATWEASPEEPAEAPSPVAMPLLTASSETSLETALEALPDESAVHQQMSDLYEESLRRVQEGEVVKGRIVSVTKDFVMVDIGYKSEGQIPIAEFTSPEGEVTAEVGDQVEALLESREDEEGPLMLSKSKASRIKVWEEISYAYHNESVVEGAIVAKVKGGLSVDLGGILAFLPGSQVDLVPVRHTDHLIGQTYTFNVLKFNRKRRHVVLSRRSLLEKAKDEAKATLLATLEEEKVVEGVVKNITDYGVFVDLGGLDGLLHITDLSYGRIRHPADLFKVGDTIAVKVLSFDREKERISLGLKQLAPDPWTTVEEKYPVTNRITGKVVSLTDYGAFVELEPGVEGLIHISEMSWTRKIRHPNQILTVGDVVEVVVLELEPQRKRISLSLKQVEPNPWEVIGEKYPVGSVIEGKIKNITDFGIFIGIDEGIDGLVHISDISWTKRFKHPSELYKKGQTVQAKVLYIDKENERFSLSIKELNPNPWQTIDERYPVNSLVTGPITNITDFGFFVEVEEGIEGLVHISELSRDKQKMAALKVGDLIRAKVIHASPQERRIGLSIRRMETEEEQRNYRDYMKSSSEATSNLGDILRETLERERSEDVGPE